MIFKKDNLYQVIKFLIGLSLIFFLFTKIETEILLEKILNINVFWLTITFIVAHINILISSLKWQWLLCALGITAGLFRLIFLYLIGTFFSNFLPSMVGGDIVRVYLLARDKKETASIVAATFTERFLGITALIVFILLILFNESVYDVFPAIAIVVSAVLFLYFLVILIIFQEKHLSYITPFKRFNLLKKIINLSVDTHSKLQYFKKKKKPILISFILSIFFYLNCIFTAYAAAQSFNINVSVEVLMIVVPLVIFISLLPISVGGLGVSEVGYVYFFMFFGISNVDALSIALLLRARVIFSSILGGIAYLLYGNSQ